jgi:hypothetical protein
MLVLRLKGNTYMEIISEERIQAEGVWVEKNAATEL